MAYRGQHGQQSRFQVSKCPARILRVRNLHCDEGMANEKERRIESASPHSKPDALSPEEQKVTFRTVAESSPPPAPANEASDGLAQLREILVGATVRELEKRVARAEAHMAARAYELEQESRRRMEVLESHLRRESDALTARLERELGQIGEAIRSATREHRESIAAADQRASKLEESVVRAQRELREQLLQQAKQFLDELQQHRREVTETLESEFEPLETGRHGEEERLTP